MPSCRARRGYAGRAAAARDSAISLRQVFWQGALTNVLNPKVALFFLAFLPQFVAADSPHKALAFSLLGLIFIFNGTLWCLGVAAFAARAAGRIRQSGRALALDQSRARRPVRLSRRPRRDASGALTLDTLSARQLKRSIRDDSGAM